MKGMNRNTTMIFYASIVLVLVETLCYFLLADGSFSAIYRNLISFISHADYELLDFAQGMLWLMLTFGLIGLIAGPTDPKLLAPTLGGSAEAALSVEELLPIMNYEEGKFTEKEEKQTQEALSAEAEKTQETHTADHIQEDPFYETNEENAQPDSASDPAPETASSEEIDPASENPLGTNRLFG